MYEIKTSQIHGRGLFATRLIKAGQTIGRIEGHKTTRNGPYVLWMDEHHGLAVTNDMRWINHADDANACYYDDMQVVALRDIQPGEEITHNYAGDDLDEVINFGKPTDQREPVAYPVSIGGPA